VKELKTHPCQKCGTIDEEFFCSSFYTITAFSKVSLFKIQGRYEEDTRETEWKVKLAWFSEMR
jgi:hypothetical protein